MRKMTRISVGALAAAFAVSALAQSALGAAHTIDSTTLGAAIVAPYVTGTEDAGDQMTVVTVTNGLTGQGINLHVIVIDEFWQSTDFNCPLTPLETTYFVFEATGSLSDNSQVTFECTQNQDTFGGKDIRTRGVRGRRGLVFMAIECLPGDPGCPSGLPGQAARTLAHNALLADATIIDFGNGSAASVPAIHIQSNGSNNGDQLYKFDGTEYLNFPSVLTSNFIAPSDDLSLELLLFTLDGKVSDTGINARVNGLVFDDDEELIASGAIVFDCFYFEDITEMFPPNGFGPSLLSGNYRVGHLELFPTSTSPNTDTNETDPLTGDSNGARRRPVHGWIFQTFAARGEIGNFGVDDPSSNDGQSSWGRVLTSGTQALSALGGDTPALNGSLF